MSCSGLKCPHVHCTNVHIVDIIIAHLDGMILNDVNFTLHLDVFYPFPQHPSAMASISQHYQDLDLACKSSPAALQGWLREHSDIIKSSTNFILSGTENQWTLSRHMMLSPYLSYHSLYNVFSCIFYPQEFQRMLKQCSSRAMPCLLAPGSGQVLLAQPGHNLGSSLELRLDLSD